MKREFFQDGCQTAQAMMPIFNRVRANPPLHLLWKFGWDPSRRSKCSADAAQNNTFRKSSFRAVINIFSKKKKNQKEKNNYRMVDTNCRLWDLKILWSKLLIFCGVDVEAIISYFTCSCIYSSEIIKIILYIKLNSY